MHSPVILRPGNTGAKQSRSLLQLRTERTFFKRLPSEGQDSGNSPGGRRRNASRGRIGKRLTLKEDSSSGLEGIDMSEVDLSRLMGGKSFTIHCTLLRNGYGVNTTALADTGANAFALLDTKCAMKLSEFLNSLLETLETPIPVKGYNGNIGMPITSLLQAHLRVDGQRQYNVPFLITDLGNHDLILGWKWLSFLDLWLDVRNRQLIWPTSLLPTPTFVKEITTSMQNILGRSPDPRHQEDANQRDKKLQEEIQLGRVRLLQCPKETPQEPTAMPPSHKHQPWTPKRIERHTERLDYMDSLQKMDDELQGKVTVSQTLPRRAHSKRTASLPPVDIYCIGAVGFYRTLIKPDATPFVTSLYEIDWLIKQKEIEEIQKESVQEELANEELITQKLPSKYNDFRDVFSKTASDTLAPHQKYDLKIELKGEHDLGFSPLHQYSAEELQACKKYLIENLNKFVGGMYALSELGSDSGSTVMRGSGSDSILLQLSSSQGDAHVPTCL